MKRDYLLKQTKERDEALDLLEKYRKSLIIQAKAIAVALAKKNGKVTSAKVLAILRENKAEGIDQVDPRFMGAVFRKGWERIGYVNYGSHKRPVSVWKLK